MNEKKIVLRLKDGDSFKEIFQCFKSFKDTDVCLVLENNFQLVTEEKFLKKCQWASKKYNSRIVFVTNKVYFKNVLKKQEYDFYPEIPPDFGTEAPRSLYSFFGRVEAKKNEFHTDPQPQKSRTKKSEKPHFHTHKIEDLKQEKSLRGLYFFGFLVLIMILGMVFIFISPQAKIVIKPKISSTEITQNIILHLPNSEIPEIEKELASIQGILVQTEVTDSRNFPSTGRKYDITNASGWITLFNETKDPKFLVPSRLSPDGAIIFRTEIPLEIPPREENKPGRVEVKIVADEFDIKGNPIGSRGNIDAGTELFLPGLREVLRESYYGKANKGPLTGGSTLTHYFIDENDFVRAKDLLKDSFRVIAIENLKKELEARSNREAKNYILLEDPNLLHYDITDYQFDASEIGAPKQTFNIEGTLLMSGFVFDESEVIDILSKKFEINKDPRKKIIEVDPSSIKYQILNPDSFKEEKWVKISISMIGVEVIDFENQNKFAAEWRQNIKKEILGKTEEEAFGVLVNHPEIEDIKSFEVSPFWSQSIPLLLDQIKLQVHY